MNKRNKKFLSGSQLSFQSSLMYYLHAKQSQYCTKNQPNSVARSWERTGATILRFEMPIPSYIHKRAWYRNGVAPSGLGQQKWEADATAAAGGEEAAILSAQSYATYKWELLWQR
jgi:hypothetical protein